MNIIIFKTSVQGTNDLTSIKPVFNALFGEKNWSFAFDDSDKILRIKSAVPCADLVVQILNDYNFLCEEMPYSLEDTPLK